MAIMTNEQFGAYVMLLCRAWNEPDCGLPADDDILAAWSRAGSRWNEIKARVLACWHQEDGRLYNERLCACYQDAQEYRQKQAERGRLGMKNRWAGHVKTEPKTSNNAAITPLYHSHNSESESESESYLELEHKKKIARSCAKRTPREPPVPHPDSIVLIPLCHTKPDGTKHQHGVTQADVDEWQALFPAVDVRQTLNEIRAWGLANPKKCKTHTGVKKFIVSWLNREQNK